MTPRQQAVAELAAQGLGYVAIGKRLKMSPHTARSHVNVLAGKIPGEDGSPLRKVMRWMLRRYAASEAFGTPIQGDNS